MEKQLHRSQEKWGYYNSPWSYLSKWNGSLFPISTLSTHFEQKKKKEWHCSSLFPISISFPSGTHLIYWKREKNKIITFVWNPISSVFGNKKRFIFFFSFWKCFHLSISVIHCAVYQLVFLILSNSNDHESNHLHSNRDKRILESTRNKMQTPIQVAH